MPQRPDRAGLKPSPEPTVAVLLCATPPHRLSRVTIYAMSHASPLCSTPPKCRAAPQPCLRVKLCSDRQSRAAPPGAHALLPLTAAPPSSSTMSHPPFPSVSAIVAMVLLAAVRQRDCPAKKTALLLNVLVHRPNLKIHS
jgi:hypothetical protein